MKRYLVSGACVAIAGGIVLSVGLQRRAQGHCQVPCGIYDDGARIKAMLEDVTTITKAVGQITELSGKHDALSINQATRWINTKEEHASNIITTVAEYFLTQKVKPVEEGQDGYEKYLKSLAVHHQVMAAALKTKQTVDPEAAEKLHHAVEALGKLYTAP